MNRISTCIRKAYARLVLFAIRPALRVEQEIREEEWRSLGRQISVVVKEQISKHSAFAKAEGVAPQEPELILPLRRSATEGLFAGRDRKTGE